MVKKTTKKKEVVEEEKKFAVVESKKHIVTEEDLEANPKLAESGVQVGDEIDLASALTAEEALEKGYDVETDTEVASKEASSASVNAPVLDDESEYHEGKKIVSKQAKEVNGKEYTEITVEGGITFLV